MSASRDPNLEGQYSADFRLPCINVGAGLEALPHFVNLDNSPYLLAAKCWPIAQLMLGGEKRKLVELAKKALESGWMKRQDCRKRLPFPDGSVRHVLCSHFLEHVYTNEVAEILGEFHRVLAVGGTVHIVVPDLEKAAGIYLTSRTPDSADSFVQGMLMSTPLRPSLRYRVMELLGYEGLKHRWMYDRQSMAKRVMAAGFELCEGVGSPSLFYRVDCNESLHIFGVKRRE